MNQSVAAAPVRDGARIDVRHVSHQFVLHSAAAILSRATDSTGYLQPTRAELVIARGLNSQYHYNAIQ